GGEDELLAGGEVAPPAAHARHGKTETRKTRTEETLVLLYSCDFVLLYFWILVVLYFRTAVFRASVFPCRLSCSASPYGKIPPCPYAAAALSIATSLATVRRSTAPLRLFHSLRTA